MPCSSISGATYGRLILGALNLLKGKVTDDGRLAIYIVLATIPAVAFGIVLKKFGYTDLERNVAIVAWNTILYGILMMIADMVGPQERTIHNMTLGSALIIGVAQALALIPGHQPVRRDHDGRQVLGLHPARTARASRSCSPFPPRPAPSCSPSAMRWRAASRVTQDAVYCAALTFVAGILAIAFLMNLLRRISFLPFVLYRMVLGGFFLVMLYS